MTRYIEAYRTSFGVEPICRTLAVAPSSYYAAQVRPPSARSIRDAELKLEIARIHAANFVGVPRVGVTADPASTRKGHRVILTTLELATDVE